MHTCNIAQVSGEKKRKQARAFDFPLMSSKLPCLVGCQIFSLMFHHVLFNSDRPECISTYVCWFVCQNSVGKLNRLTKKSVVPCCANWRWAKDSIILRHLDHASMCAFFLCSNPIINLNRLHAPHADLSACRWRWAPFSLCASKGAQWRNGGRGEEFRFSFVP